MSTQARFSHVVKCNICSATWGSNSPFGNCTGFKHGDQGGQNLSIIPWDEYWSALATHPAPIQEQQQESSREQRRIQALREADEALYRLWGQSEIGSAEMVAIDTLQLQFIQPALAQTQQPSTDAPADGN